MTSQWLRAACASAVVALAATACSGGGSSSRGNSAAPGIGVPEKTTLQVAVVPAMDSAGFFVALQQGLFAKEGLTIKYSPATSSETAIGTQLKGGYDITAGNYVSYVQAVANGHDPLQIVAEGSVMQTGSQVIFAMPHSGINKLTRAWAQKYPNTLKRFLTALKQGQQLADTDRAAVEQAFESLPDTRHGKVAPMTAATIALNTYPLSIDAIRLQRVANVMLQFGLLKTRFKVTSMIAPASEVSLAG